MKRTVVLFSLLLAAAMLVPAENRQWTGAGENANWGNTDNWDTGVPGTGDRAYFTAVNPATTSVNVDDDYTLERANPALLLNFNRSNSYTFSGPGSLTFLSDDTTTRNMVNIVDNAKDTTQTFNIDLIFNAAGNQRIATSADSHFVFNGNLTGKQNVMVRLNDLNSTATFNGNVILENNSVLQLYGGTITFNNTVLGDEDGGVVVMQAQGRDTLVLLNNADGPVFDPSLGRAQMGAAAGNDTTIRMEAADQVASDIWMRVALWDLNGHDNKNTGTFRLSTDGDSGAIQFGNGEAVWFADSSGMLWEDAVLDLIDFEFGRDEIRFGTDADGLTQSQLGKIRIDGQVVDGLALDGGGYLIPEPATMGMLGIGVLIVVTVRRRFMRR